MKNLMIVGFVLGGGALLGWWGLNSMTTQDSFLVSVAFGFPKNDEIELHGVISLGMTAQESPRVDPKTLKPDWDEWVHQHLDLRDAENQAVEMYFRTGNDVIPLDKIKGAAEGYFFAKLKQNGAYNLDYIPKRAEPTRFRYSFTAPATDVGLETPAFVKP